MLKVIYPPPLEEWASSVQRAGETYDTDEWVHPCELPQESAKLQLAPRAFSCWVLCLTSAGLLLIALVNWLVNPYGQYAPRFFRPIVQESRSEKVQLFNALESQPAGLILGSSRAMKFEPEYLHQKSSIRFFNFAVNHGRPEDFLAILRMYQQRYGQSPKRVLIGVDVAALDDVIPSDARIAAEPTLHRHVKDVLPWGDEFDRVSQLLSFQQSASSIQSIKLSTGLAKTRTQEVQFDSDGVIQYLARQKQIDEGTFDLAAGLQYNAREFTAVFSRLKRLSKTRLGILRETLRHCKDNGCHVDLFVTVNHPELRKILAEKTQFLSLEATAIESIREICTEMNANFFNFGSIETFDGDSNDFVDGIHPRESNTRKMIDRMLSEDVEVTCALQ
jgi:hypothetical protein